MDDQNPTTTNQTEPNPAPPPPDVSEPSHAPAAQPATAQQLADVEQLTTGFEKATLRWARIAVVMSGLAALFVCAQWYEMRRQSQFSHHALSVTQKAYVNVQDVKVISFEAGKTPEAEISYKNAGLTPARFLLAVPRSFIRELKNGKPPEPQTSKQGIGCFAPDTGIHYSVRTNRGDVLPPGVTRSVRISWLTVGDDPESLSGSAMPLTRDEFQAVQSYVKHWYVVLYISYYDQFGNCSGTAEPFEYDAQNRVFRAAQWGWQQEDHQYQNPN